MDQFPLLGQPDTGDTAWMLVSSAMVLLMTPGLAFFYGGMVRAKSVLNMIMMSVSAMGVVTVLWVLYGYSLAFGNDVGNLFGDPSQFFGLKGLIGGNAAAEVIADPSTGAEAAAAVANRMSAEAPAPSPGKSDAPSHHLRPSYAMAALAGGAFTMGTDAADAVPEDGEAGKQRLAGRRAKQV